MKIEEARIGMEVEVRFKGEITNISTSKKGTSITVRFDPNNWSDPVFPIEFVEPLEEPKNG